MNLTPWGLIFQQCSHLRGLRLGCMLHITFREKRGLLILYRCYFSLSSLHTYCTPLSKTSEECSSALQSHLLFCTFFPSPFYLPLRELKVKVENPRPGCSGAQDPLLAYICRGRKHTDICAHACSHVGACCNMMEDIQPNKPALTKTKWDAAQQHHHFTK